MRGLYPILPIREIVLLPGMITRIQITHPQAVSAVEFHLQHARPLVVVPQLGVDVDDILPEDLNPIGCLAVVQKVVRLGDGTLRLLIEGQARVSVSGVRNDPEAGLSATARPEREGVTSPEQVDALAQKVREGLKALINSQPSHVPSLGRVADLEMPPGRLADMVAANLTLPHPARLTYLNELSVDARLDKVVLDLAREQELFNIAARVQKEVQTTMDRQQREYYLREQIRGLRKELGEVPEALDEASALEKKLREAGMPAASLEEALRELERLRRMHPDAAEYTVTRTWLEWLAAMPWSVTTEDKTDIHEAARVLDEDHYGLEKVKDRILEYLAVRQLNPTGKGPVLCFLGPPGVGKTSLGRSIAKALGRNFQRVSLGGVKDEAEIRGHRRTYVGALPGRIIHAMKRAASRNPVIILDEIDKIGKDQRGDPSSALLEVLDPEQNHEFSDHYLDVAFDLSQVLFICTANQGDPIPSALYDRLEIIEIPGYILEEKLEIARRHLLPRARVAHGLREDQLQVSAEAVRGVVEAYTHEAGVRGLERQLGSLHRKVARKVVEGATEAFVVANEADVTTLLGPPRHLREVAEAATQPGIVIGLAWTEAGGDILFIEATGYSGAGGGLKLTGKLGEVMKESVEAALSVIRTRADALGIDPAVFRDGTLHVHVPAGAIPKDGPSAGVGMVTALMSLLTGRVVRPALAMTGEITLRGRVMQVGGIKEKVLAARRAGVTEVILPARNKADLEDIPAPLRSELRYHFVDTVDEVLALALEAEARFPAFAPKPAPKA
jgi:ATP-dependent Lon protease